MVVDSSTRFNRRVGVIGGCGHVGLPLALIFAESRLRTLIYDINRESVAQVRSGVMPFQEEGAQALLEQSLAAGLLEVTADPAALQECEHLVLIIGTPVDEHLSPTFHAIERTIEQCAPFLRDGQILILRSTVFPGMSRWVAEDLRRRRLNVDVAFCPERVAQGHSLREFRQLPQIVSAFNDSALRRARDLFSHFSSEFIEMSPEEAELCKLMTNAWRYIQFATVNQFYLVATEHGLDFERILHGCRHNYPRMQGMPGPGLAAGPCLIKDTMQLAAFSRNSFVLGHAAMLINEGLPAHLVELAKRERSLKDSTAGILGMAFKAESDDPRDSLSYKLRKLLQMEARHVLCTDPFVRDPRLVPLERVLAESDVLFVATPHRAYRGLAVPPGRTVIDVWRCIVESRPEPAGPA